MMRYRHRNMFQNMLILIIWWGYPENLLSMAWARSFLDHGLQRGFFDIFALPLSYLLTPLERMNMWLSFRLPSVSSCPRLNVSCLRLSCVDQPLPTSSFVQGLSNITQWTFELHEWVCVATHKFKGFSLSSWSQTHSRNHRRWAMVLKTIISMKITVSTHRKVMYLHSCV